MMRYPGVIKAGSRFEADLLLRGSAADHRRAGGRRASRRITIDGKNVWDLIIGKSGAYKSARILSLLDGCRSSRA